MVSFTFALPFLWTSFGSLSGMFIVEGLEKLLPKPLQNITQHTFAIRDFPFDNLFVTTYNLSNTVAGQDRLTVNGEINPVID